MAKKLTLKEKISYGFGDMGNGFMFDMGQAYLMKFFTDVVGIASSAAGGIFMVTKIFDAFMDPIAGTVIDSRKFGKRGKFKPVMMIGEHHPCDIVRVRLPRSGSVPDGQIDLRLRGLYAVGIGYSFTNVPYGSLSAAMTKDPEDRTSLASFRQMGSVLALLITGVAVMPFVTKFSGPKVGFPVIIGIFAVLGVLSFYVTYRNTKEVYVQEAPQEKHSFKSVFKTIGSNKPPLAIGLMTIFSISAYNIKSAVMIYYAQYTLGNVNLVSTLNFITIGCSVIGLLIMPWLAKRFGNKQTMIIGFIISIICDTINFLMPNNIVIFTILASLAFFGISIVNAVTWALVNDVIDYGEWHTGKRTEGIIFSSYNFFRKIAQSLSGFASGIGLSLVGYVPNAHQSAGTLMGIKGSLLLYPAVCAADRDHYLCQPVQIE
ncbi:glycoside-pentoside-hexuronide (GPH):cation symporter [Paenibacillus sp. P26]|nr:glycoside-pentoside-hexuronide (GPH):cation symporter [Paenibacillus sp. P26]